MNSTQPWDVQGITGVHGFLKKVWKLFQLANGKFSIEDQPSKRNKNYSHSTIKKVKEDLDRFSFNTPVSAFMICVNDLLAVKCTNREVLTNLCLLPVFLRPSYKRRTVDAFGKHKIALQMKNFLSLKKSIWLKKIINIPFLSMEK